LVAAAPSSATAGLPLTPSSPSCRTASRLVMIPVDVILGDVFGQVLL